MKILLVGNYDRNGQSSMSMQRFASMLNAGFSAAGHETRLLVPARRRGRPPGPRHARQMAQIRADEFFVFPRILKQASRMGGSRPHLRSRERYLR